MYAVSLGLHKIVKLLIDRRAHVDTLQHPDIIFSCVDRNLMFKPFNFPLFRYKQVYNELDIDHVECLKHLLQAGCDPNKVRDDEVLRYPIFYTI